jgi:hypothetical protein
MKRYTGKLCCDLSKSIEDNKLKIENLIKRGLTGLNAPKGQVTSFEKSIEMYNAGISKDEIKAWVWYKRTTKSVNDAKYIKIWKDYVIPLGNTKENIKKAKEKLTNYAFEDRHPLMILNENSPQWWNAYLEFFEQTVRYGNRYKNVWEEIEKPVVSIPKTSKPKYQPKVKSVVNKKDVDFHTTDYVLIRRFYTTIKKLKVEFRPLQLLFQAFQKAAMERKVRATSETADLFTKVNKKITSYFEQVVKNTKWD